MSEYEREEIVKEHRKLIFKHIEEERTEKQTAIDAMEKCDLKKTLEALKSVYFHRWLAMDLVDSLIMLKGPSPETGEMQSNAESLADSAFETAILKAEKCRCTKL